MVGLFALITRHQLVLCSELSGSSVVEHWAVRSHWKTQMNITNKSRLPLSIPLPGGKRLFLGPGKTGQVSNKALEHPPLIKLLQAGDIETAVGGPKRKDGGTGNAWSSTGARHSGSSAKRQSGDR